MKKDYRIIIIGAGVAGLAIANCLSKRNIKSVLIIEKDESFGRGISSRNSEVIHSGIYYPKGSLKQKLCLKGRELIYEFCRLNNIWFNQCGKLIIAQKDELSALEHLYDNALTNEIGTVDIIDSKILREKNDLISAYCALQVNSTGIVSCHDLMHAFFNLSQENDHDYLFKSSVVDAYKISYGFELDINNANNEIEKVTSEIVINAAGLSSDKIGNLVLKTDSLIPKIIYSKGCYFKLSPKWKNKFKQLVYPVPDYSNQALGIHVTIDKDNYARLGPNAFILEQRIEDYYVEPNLVKEFYNKAKKYIPTLNMEDLTPDYSGIRPKILENQQTFNDFYIKNETKNGLEGWINLIGIESPGLTSSMAIGEKVMELINL